MAVVDAFAGVLHERLHYEESEDKMYFETVQDVEPILEANKRAFDVDAKTHKSETMNHVARIPMVVIEAHYRKTGCDLMKDSKALMKFLNDPENRFLRTKPGKL